MIKVKKNLKPMIMVFFALLIMSSCISIPKTIKVEPLPSPSAYVERGMTYFQNKDFEKASAYFKKAIESDMHYIPAHSYLALSYAHLGKKEKAIQEFKKVVEIGPNTDDASSAQKWLKRLSKEPTAIVLSERGSHLD